MELVNRKAFTNAISKCADRSAFCIVITVVKDNIVVSNYHHDAMIYYTLPIESGGEADNSIHEAKIPQFTIKKVKTKEVVAYLKSKSREGLLINLSHDGTDFIIGDKPVGEMVKKELPIEKALSTVANYRDYITLDRSRTLQAARAAKCLRANYVVFCITDKVIVEAPLKDKDTFRIAVGGCRRYKENFIRINTEPLIKALALTSKKEVGIWFKEGTMSPIRISSLSLDSQMDGTTVIAPLTSVHKKHIKK